jgi:hypothetical protein
MKSLSKSRVDRSVRSDVRKRPVGRNSGAASVRAAVDTNLAAGGSHR